MKIATALLIVAVFSLTSGSNYSPALATKKQEYLDRSPVDCVFTPDERFLVSTNQTSGTLSVVDLVKHQVIQELKCGEYPTRLAITSDGKHVLASATFSHEVISYDLDDKGQLKEAKRLWLGFEPRGIVIDKNNQKAYVALCTAHKIAVLDLHTMKEENRIPVGRWPYSLAITPDGKTLIATGSGDGTMSFVDLATNKVLREEPFAGLNQGQIVVSPDSQFVYSPYIYHFGSGPTERTIKLGWVTTSRIVRLRVNEAKRVASLYLDTQGLAVADPLGLAVTPNQEWMACSASGTHEVLFFRNEKLPFLGFSSKFLIDEDLRKDSNRYFRLPVGGRPMYITFSKDNRHLYVANYLLNAIQVIDIADRKIAHTIYLGGPKASPWIPPTMAASATRRWCLRSATSPTPAPGPGMAGRKT
jgi:YVTN family beta-propeller protein